MANNEKIIALAYGFDPGVKHVAYAVVGCRDAGEGRRPVLEVLDSGEWGPGRGADFTDAGALRELDRRVFELVGKGQEFLFSECSERIINKQTGILTNWPLAAGVESAAMVKNVRNIVNFYRTGQATGAIKRALADRGVKVYGDDETGPTSIRKSLGSGRLKKRNVRRRLSMLLKIDEPRNEHEGDAIAVACSVAVREFNARWPAELI